MDIISRDAARAAGRARFFTGEPCNWGHVAERFVSSRRCVVCNREDQRKQRAQNPERVHELWRAWKARNPDKKSPRVKWKDMTPEQRERVRVLQRQWRERNREKVRARWRTYYQKPENNARRRARNRLYQQRRRALRKAAKELALRNGAEATTEDLK